MEKDIATSETTRAAEASLGRDLLKVAAYYLANRQALAILAVVAIIGGVALNWSWLVAIGIAPILLAALPCVIMCGLGLCMAKMAGRSCATEGERSQSTEPAVQSSISPQAIAETNSLLTEVSSCCGATADNRPATDLRQTQAPDERRTPHA